MKKQGYGGVSCDNDCSLYAWHDVHLNEVKKADPSIDIGLDFFNVYKGHHPSCKSYPKVGVLKSAILKDDVPHICKTGYLANPKA